MATADVRCKDQTNLVALWSAAETQYQQAAVKKDSKYFTKRRNEVVQQIEAARKVLATHRP